VSKRKYAGKDLRPYDEDLYKQNKEESRRLFLASEAKEYCELGYCSRAPYYLSRSGKQACKNHFEYYERRTLADDWAKQNKRLDHE